MFNMFPAQSIAVVMQTDSSCKTSLQELVEELKIANAQHEVATAAHIQVLDLLLDVHDESMRDKKAQFHAEIDGIIDEFERLHREQGEHKKRLLYAAGLLISRKQMSDNQTVPSSTSSSFAMNLCLLQ